MGPTPVVCCWRCLYIFTSSWFLLCSGHNHDGRHGDLLSLDVGFRGDCINDWCCLRLFTSHQIRPIPSILFLSAHISGVWELIRAERERMDGILGWSLVDWELISLRIQTECFSPDSFHLCVSVLLCVSMCPSHCVAFPNRLGSVKSRGEVSSMLTEPVEAKWAGNCCPDRGEDW